MRLCYNLNIDIQCITSMCCIQTRAYIYIKNGEYSNIIIVSDI